MKQRRVGFLAFPGVMMLDLAGPMDAFGTVGKLDQSSPYELVVIGLTPREIRTSSGLMLKPDTTISEPLDLDTLIIPGGQGSRAGSIAGQVCPWLGSVAPRIRRVASVCTGIYLLAPTGLLDGRRVTTHWAHCADVGRRFPKLTMEPDAIFLKSDRYYTSAGITAGIDLSLALIEEDLGTQVALRVARNLVVYLKRPGGQRQYSEPLRLQAEASDQLSGLLPWMMKNLHEDLSVEALADHTSLSRRQVTRIFAGSFGASPAEVVEDLRLDQARLLLLESGALVENVARAVGFSSADSFRRAFSRKFGVSPKQFRAPFRSADAGEKLAHAPTSEECRPNETKLG